MPELPHVTRARLMSKGLSERDADVLMAIDMGREVGYDGVLGQGAVSYFDVVSERRDPKVVVNWYVERAFPSTCSSPFLNPISDTSRITHELLGQLAVRHETFKENTMTTEQLGELIDLVQSGKITGTSGNLTTQRGFKFHLCPISDVCFLPS